MRKFLILIVSGLVFLICASASAQLMMLGYGRGGGGGGSIPACGTGVINLSTGCTQPMLGGL